MKVEIKKQEKTKVEIEFECEWPEFQDYYNKSLVKMSQGLVLDGFRPGKAPLDIAEKKIGQAKILEDAAEMLLQKNYPKLLQENNIEVIGQPQVEILKLAKGNDFACKLKAEILPEINLPDYKKIASSVEKQEVKVDDEDIEKVLTQIARMNATFEDLAGSAQKGDLAQIEYQSPQVEDNKQYEDRFFLGDGHFTAGFEENIEGMKQGEEKEFNIVFPDDYFQKQLAGEKVDFKVKLVKAQKAIFPVMNDEFVKRLGNFDSVDNLKKNIKDGLSQEKALETSQKARTEILSKIVEKTQMEAPALLVEKEKEKIRHEIEHEVGEKLQTRGGEQGRIISFDEYIKENFGGPEKFEEFLTKNAENQAKGFLILQEIGKQEKIKVEEVEVDLAAAEFLRQYDNDKVVENKFDPIALRSYYKGVVYNEKVFQVLESFVKT